jgi:hypothetical protein
LQSNGVAEISDCSLLLGRCLNTVLVLETLAKSIRQL